MVCNSSRRERFMDLLFRVNSSLRAVLPNESTLCLLIWSTFEYSQNEHQWLNSSFLEWWNNIYKHAKCRIMIVKSYLHQGVELRGIRVLRHLRNVISRVKQDQEFRGKNFKESWSFSSVLYNPLDSWQSNSETLKKNEAFFSIWALPTVFPSTQAKTHHH